jgi:exodeoxyribonuclease V alpha subunit
MPDAAVARQQDGLRLSLLRRVRGIGVDRAQRLLEAFNDNIDVTLSDLANTEAVATIIAPARPVLARRLAAVLMAQWQEELRPEYETMAWLDSNAITDQPGLARKMVRILGAQTRSTLESNPYVLAKTLAWLRMDGIGRKALGLRIGPDDVQRAPQRLLGAIDNAIGDWMRGGHTAISKSLLRQMIEKRLDRVDAFTLDLAEHLGEKHGRLAEAGEFWRFPGCAFLEREVASKLEAMAHEPGRIVPTEAELDCVLAEVVTLLPRPLSAEQMAAVRHALTNPFAVITGGAGTGKTAAMQALVLAWEILGGRVHLAALAGKAALRLSQATHRLAKTLHRTLAELALRVAAEADGKWINPDWTELDDASLVIVDEASMPDLGQWAKLLKAMPSGCRLVMVGDTAQLPPIGFGLVFHLLAQRPDTANLTKIFRQEAASGIPVVANAIRHQIDPNLEAFTGLVDGVSMRVSAVTAIDLQVEGVVEALGGFGEDGLALHIVAATNLRVAGLNRRFHDRRRRGHAEVKGYLGAYFSPGDPVVHLENDYKRGLFNGMTGTVVTVNTALRSVEVMFDGEAHVFTRDELIRLDLAYALTCHKLQGSQAQSIVVVIEPTRLLEPSWLYTAVTRAERQAVLVGPPTVLKQALEREFAWKTRCVGMVV